MNVLKPHLQTTVWTLLDAGASQREIERVTGIDRKTIRAYQKRFAAAAANSPGVATGCLAQFPPPRPPALRVAAAAATVSACEPHRAFIEAQLRLRRNATAVYQDLVDQFGFTGAYGSVKRFVRHLRQREPEQFDRLEFLPGEEMQVDYGEGAPTRKPGTDRYRKPRLFVATLRYSRRSFRRVVWNSSQETWARLHEQAWRYFAGSCRYVVLDNLKEGVLKPDLYEPELNPVYAATLAHYGVVADPARVRDPNRKGSVENAIGHTQATALKGRRFESLEEQNDFLEHWECKWAAPRIHGSARRQVQAMFEEERSLLQPLPTLGMQFFTESQRTVCAPGRRRGRHRRLGLGAGHAAADDRGRARPGLMHSLVSAQPTQERREDADRHHYRDQPATTERVGDAVRMSVHCPARRSGCPACCHAAYFAGSLRRP